VKNLNCLDVETIEKNLKNETSEENDITTGNNNENEQNKIPEIPGIIQDALNTLLVANEYLDGELAKYETWESLNESIKTLSASAALAMAGGLRFVDFGCGKFSTTDFSDLNNSEHRSQRTGRKKDKMRNCYFRNLNFCLRFRV
jgi:hypothetical protein